METTDRITYLKAKHRVAQIKSFYTHILVYALINVFIITAKILNNLNNGETFEQAFLIGAPFCSNGLGCFYADARILYFNLTNDFRQKLGAQ